MRLTPVIQRTSCQDPHRSGDPRRDGWLLNRVTGNKPNDLDMWAARAIVDFRPEPALGRRKVLWTELDLQMIDLPVEGARDEAQLCLADFRPFHRPLRNSASGVKGGEARYQQDRLHAGLGRNRGF